MSQDQNELMARLAIIEARLTRVEDDNHRQNTAIQAADQAIAAMNQAQLAGKLAKENKEFLKALNRRLNSLICIVCGLGLLYLGRETWIDTTNLNDDIGKALLFIGAGFVGYGLLVSNGNEQWLVAVVKQWLDRR